MHPLAKLARSAVNNYVSSGTVIAVPLDFPPEFTENKAGVFVTIERNGRLRGCIGTYLPCRESIARETVINAIAAAGKDHRFDPISESELPDLDFTVYVLNEPEPVANLEDLDHQKYGVIVISKRKTGLLLPDLDGVDSVEQQISIACSKADIDPARESISVYRFTVDKHK